MFIKQFNVTLIYLIKLRTSKNMDKNDKFMSITVINYCVLIFQNFILTGFY